MRHLVRLFALVLATLFALPVAGQNYPVRPIRLYLAFPPGGAADIVARLLAQPLSARLRQPASYPRRRAKGPMHRPTEWR